jgi:hypothetical protein
MKEMRKRIIGWLTFSLFIAIVASMSLAQEAKKESSDTQSSGPNKFYGPITKVDTKKGTFTVGDQTFTIIPESELTTKDDKKATLADAVVGEPARGTYTKKSDGTLNVTKVRFGKKTGGKADGKNADQKKSDSATVSKKK